MKKSIIIFIAFMILFNFLISEQVNDTWEENDKELDFYYATMDYENGRIFAQKVLFATKDKYGKNSLETALAYNYLALFEAALENYDNAIDNYKNALDIVYDLKDYANIGVIAGNTGYSYYAIQQYELALQYYNKSYESFQKAGIDDNVSNVIQTLYDRSLVYDVWEDYKKSIEDMKMVVELYEKEFGRDAQLASDYVEIGVLYKFDNNFNKALENYNMALDIYSELEDNKYDQEIAILLNNIGVLYGDYDKYNEAVEYYNKALVYYANIGDLETNEEAPNTFYNRGLAYYYLENYDKALEDIEKAYIICEKIYGEEHQSTQFFKEEFEALKELLKK